MTTSQQHANALLAEHQAARGRERALAKGASRAFQDLTGCVFGLLTVLSRGPNKRKHTRWNCRCECGETALVQSSSLKSGATKSCGCRRSAIMAGKMRKHGGDGTPEYSIWVGMRQRCNNKRHKNFADYGGRGIKVCERWDSFENFLADIGPRPSAHLTIERINNDGGYEPNNCCWATRAEQRMNQRQPLQRSVA